MITRPRASSRVLKKSYSPILPALSTIGKRLVFPDLGVSRFTFHEQCRAVLLVAFGLAGLIACERTPDQAPEAKKAVVAERPGVLHLTSEELARTVIEITPVVRGQLLMPREFPATVQANANEMAEVTTLIKGRVMKVYVDVGQDVK